MVDELFEEVTSVLSDLEVHSRISGDAADALRSCQLTEEFARELKQAGKFFATKQQLCKLLFNDIVAIGREHQGSKFWDVSVELNLTPGLIQGLCYALLKSSSGKRYGALLYCALLGIEPCSMMWNSMIFNEVLSIMVAAAQLFHGRAEIDEFGVRAVMLTGELFVLLSQCVSESFKNLAGIDVVIALIELAVQLCTIHQKEFLEHYRDCGPKAMKFLDVVANLWVEYTLPSVTLALLLDFLPATKSVTAHVVKIRDSFLEFCDRHLKGNDSQLGLLAKHVIMRTTDRHATRANSAIVIQRLMAIMNDYEPTMKIILRLSRAQKQALRVTALTIFRKFLDEGILPISEEDQREMVERVRLAIMDQIPSVRAAAMLALASMIPSSSKPILEELGLEEDVNGFNLLSELTLRIRDEKLNVRKGCLKCLKALLEHSGSSPNLAVLELIAERTRDRCVYVRQEAINILSTAACKYDSEEVNRLWLDNVLPLALDTDSKTQEVALSQINECIVKSSATRAGMKRIESLGLQHMDLMRKVIRTFVQKSIPLAKLSKSLESHLAVDAHPTIWRLESILLSEAPTLARINYLQFWEDRNQLPSDYLSIIADMALQNEEVIEDVVVFLREIAEGKVTDSEFTMIHAMVNIMVGTYDEYQRESTCLITRINDHINSAVTNAKLHQSDLVKMTRQVFLMGELLEHTKSLKNMDFTGLQLMIAERLPNQVTIPECVRAIAAISLGKLCLFRRDFSSSFVAAFVAQLHDQGNSAVKCNCLVILCDLCVRYSATVDPYVLDMSACFADTDPMVRHQSLLIMTKLLAEDYLKVRPIVFFRFLFCLVDSDDDVANFARSCLFDVINVKDPRLLADNFVRTLLYFNEMLDHDNIGEAPEQHEKFKITDPERRKKLYQIVISQMNSTSLFRLMEILCSTLLAEYAHGVRDLQEGEALLDDAFDVMIFIEEEMQEFHMVDSATSDDPRTEQIVTESLTIMNYFHKQLVQKILPTLNQLHQYLRIQHSPLQRHLKDVYKTICLKHTSLIDELERQEPVLAMELKNEISAHADDEPTAENIPSSPKRLTPFRSPLLSRIAREPQILFGSATSSPLIHIVSRSQSRDEDLSGRKRPPIQLED